MSVADRKIVFAGPARDVAAFVKGVTRNIESFAGGFAAWAVVIAENDSRDDSKALLRTWMERAREKGAVKAILADMDGLDRRHPQRTARIAAARNRILQEIEQDPELSGFDYLAMMDMDFPNSVAMPPQNFAAAADFLEQHPDVAGVFPNQLPLYYDIWALREKDWCPRDCWDEVAEAMATMSRDAAIEKYVYARQRSIHPSQPPIAVDSAFGGIGLYRMKSILGHRYNGLKPDGGEIVDHVAFHDGIREKGGKFFILPGFLNLTSFEHTAIPKTHTMMPLKVGANQLRLLVERSSPITQIAHYGERFAMLASLYARQSRVPLLDLGAHLGESLALARLYGCDSPYICIVGGELEYAILSANALMHAALFGDVRLMRAQIANGVEAPADLVRLCTGNDAPLLGEDDIRLRPMVWARIEGLDQADGWDAALAGLPHENVIAFNAPGTAIAAGRLQEQKERLVSLFRRLPKGSGGLDVAFFDKSAHALFERFRVV